MELPDRERWDEINEIVARARQQSADDRHSFLVSACGDDRELLRDVESLLSAADTYDPLFEAGAAALAQPFLSAESAPKGNIDDASLEPGEDIGAYQLVECVGEGGTSVVYRAKRVDEQFERTVAVKILRRVLERDEETIERFQAERQILASVSHPHLAEVYDGGVLPDGRPYLVMEYVDGRPITTHCREETCSLDERLAFFRQAAEAVQAAHEQLVVHRDLKPSNVMVERETETVKLLDFGIAKMLGDLPGAVAPATRTGRHPMTPAYAAPEQVRGEDISVATDTYALGLLLYELLAETRPIGDANQSPYGVARAVCEEEPDPPSRAVDDPARRTVLKGDLDAIVTKAIRKSPADRYDTVEALLRDLERYEKNEPVGANRGGWKYRVSKFARRNRQSIVAGIAAVLVLLSFGVYHVQQLRTERNEAQRAAEKAEEVSDFMVGLFEASNPAGETAGDVTAHEILQQGRKHVSRLDNQPAVQAQMLDAMGRAHVGLGNYATADSLLRRALSIRQTLYDGPHPALAASFGHLSQALDGRGKYAEAESLAQKSLRMRKSFERDDPAQIAESLRHLALYKKRQGSYATAESLLTRTLSLQREADATPTRDRAATLNNLAQVHLARGNYARAESLHRETLSMREALLGREHPKVSESLNNLAMALERQGHFAEAESLYREALAIDRAVLGSKHPYVPQDMNNLAVLLEKRGRYAEAESLKRKSLALRREILPADHPDITVALNNLAVLLRKRGAHEEAASLFRQVLERNRSHFDGPHPYIAATLGNLGDTYRERERYHVADSLYRASLSMMKTVYDETHPRIATALEKRVDILSKQHRYQEAERLQRHALSIRKRELGPDHPKTAESIAGVGDLLLEQKHYDRAEVQYRRALSILETELSKTDWRRAYVQAELGACIAKQEEYAKADSLLRSAYDVLKTQRGTSDRYSRRVAQDLADLYASWGRTDDATHFERLARAE